MEHWADFECALAYHCAPSLVGIKAADLFSWPVEPGSRVADYARAFADRGICLRVLRRGAERMLLLVYRPERLAETLGGAEVRRLLDRAGYPPEATLEELLTILSRRLHGSSFPHEIGLFPGTIRDVIFDVKYAVQFEPVSNGTIYQEPTERSVLAAKMVLNGTEAVGESLYFYAPALSQGAWINQNRTYYTTIGCHKFYL